MSEIVHDISFKGFFNSKDKDRRYKAEDWARYFSMFIGNGVFPNPSSNFQIIANTGLSVVVKKGNAWINGYYGYQEDDLKITLNLPDGRLNRWDRIMLRWDINKRSVILVVREGDLSSNPAPLAPIRRPDMYEIVLGDVYMEHGALNITQSKIKDQRLDPNLCGIVHGVVDQIDTSTIALQLNNFINDFINQSNSDYNDWSIRLQNYINGASSWISDFKSKSLDDVETWFEDFTESKIKDYNDFKDDRQNSFDDWFDTVQSTLDGDQAANLFNKIENHEKTMVDSTSGVHGMRFADGKLQVKISVGWITLATANLGQTWSYKDNLGLTWLQEDSFNRTWEEIENLMETEA